MIETVLIAKCRIQYGDKRSTMDALQIAFNEPFAFWSSQVHQVVKVVPGSCNEGLVGILRKNPQDFGMLGGDLGVYRLAIDTVQWCYRFG